jgi:hypothetical protein
VRNEITVVQQMNYRTFSKMEKPGLTLPLPTGLSRASRINERDEAKNGLQD